MHRSVVARSYFGMRYIDLHGTLWYWHGLCSNMGSCQQCAEQNSEGPNSAGELRDFIWQTVAFVLELPQDAKLTSNTVQMKQDRTPIAFCKRVLICFDICHNLPLDFPIHPAWHLCMRSLNDIASFKDSCKRSVMFVTCTRLQNLGWTLDWVSGWWSNQKIARKNQKNGSQEMCLSARPNSAVDSLGQAAPVRTNSWITLASLVSWSSAKFHLTCHIRAPPISPLSPAALLSPSIQAPFDVLLTPRDLAFQPEGWVLEYFDAMITCNTAAVTQPYFKIFKYLPRPK